MNKILFPFFLFFFLLSCKQAQIADMDCPFSKTQSGLSCGKLLVPENRQKANSRSISLQYVILEAQNFPSSQPPIVFLQGGPGGGAIALRAFWANSPLRENRDIILLDQRGAGFSGLENVDFSQDIAKIFAQDLSIAEEQKALLSLSRRSKQAAQKEKMDFSAYNTLESVEDLEALRKELKIEKWVILGGSYGSRLALSYMEKYEPYVESAILLSLFPREINLYESLISNFNQALEKVFQACEKDPSCQGQYPSLQKVFMHLMEGFQKKAMKVDFQGENFYLNGQDFLLFLHQMLYNQVYIEQIPNFIYELYENKNPSVSLSIQRSIQAFGTISAAMYWSVNAFEEIPFSSSSDLEKDLKRNPHLKPGPAFFMADPYISAQWHSFRAPASENTPVKSNLPVLIIQGAFDPITPSSNAQQTLAYLKNAQYFEFPYDGHVVLNACFFDLAEQFLEAPSESVQSDCISKSPGLNFR